ncbi:MAG: DUF4316 domain-containing protein [Lachnospiraceae bacterium]|nr:DUF4316 domain-containing protein [Lachnospiraceae bacterium]
MSCYLKLRALLKEMEATEDLHFRSVGELRRQGMEPEADHYEIIYTEPLPPSKDRDVFLEDTFRRFNLDRPESFRGHSLSVSDIVAIRQNGEITAHFVDTIGFQELPGFFSGKNYLRTVEDMIEQNDNNLDGIINNLLEDAKPEAFEKQKKPSILEALKGTEDTPGISVRKTEREVI